MIRKIEKRDSEEYLKMAKDFYSSSAVLHPVPEEYFKRTLDEMLTSDRYAEGYIVSFADKYCATRELMYSLSKKYKQRFLKDVERISHE